MLLLARLRCLRFGHDPGPDAERDVFGRPVRCGRCGAYDAEMATWQWHRFLGIDVALRFEQVAREAALEGQPS